VQAADFTVGHVPQLALPVDLTVPDFFLLMAPKPEVYDSRPRRKYELTFCITEGTGAISLIFVAARYAEFKQG
jgi:hypothetical protein